MEVAESSKTTVIRERLSVRNLLMLLLLGAAIVILSACEATVKTGLTLNTDGSGSRVMVVEFADADNQNNEYLRATPEQVDESIKKRLPEELTYDGVTHDGKGMKTTFTLAFDSVADYQDKVAKLMALTGGKPGGASVYLFLDNPLQSGNAVYEDFASKDILKWMPTGLAEDGYLDKENVDKAIGSDSYTLTLNGETIKSEYSTMMYHNDTKGTGFSSVAFGTALDGEVMARRAVFSVSNEDTYKKYEKRFNAYFAELKKNGLEVSPIDNDDYKMWMVEYRGTAEEIAEKTNIILFTNDAEFSLGRTLKKGTTDKVVTTLEESAQCGQICLDSSKIIQDYITINEGMTVGKDFEVVQGSVASPMNRGADKFTYESSLSISKPTYALSIDAQKTPQLSATFVVPNRQAQVYGDFLNTLIAGDSGAQVTFDEGAEETTFTAKIAGKDSTEFNKTLQAWLGKDAGVTVEKGAKDSFFVENYEYSVNLPAPSFIAQGTAVSTTATFDKSLPIDSTTFAGDGKTEAAGNSATFESADKSTFAVQSSERTTKGLATIIGGAVLALLLIGLVIFLIVRKKRVTKGESTGSAETREASAVENGVATGGSEAFGSGIVDTASGTVAPSVGTVDSATGTVTPAPPSGGRPSSQGATVVGSPAEGEHPRSVPPVVKPEQPALKSAEGERSAPTQALNVPRPPIQETKAFDRPTPDQLSAGSHDSTGAVESSSGSESASESASESDADSVADGPGSGSGSGSESDTASDSGSDGTDAARDAGSADGTGDTTIK